MVAKATAASKNVDGLLKSMLVLSRTVDHVLESRAVKAVVRNPLSSSKVQILRLLGRCGGQTSTQVARFLGVTKPAVTQIIDSMVRAKLVTRRVGKDDRREVILQLSKRGQDVQNSVRRSQRTSVRNALKHSSGRSVSQWIKTLNEIAAAIGQADNAYQHFCAQCAAHEDETCLLAGADGKCLFTEQTDKRASRALAAKASQ